MVEMDVDFPYDIAVNLSKDIRLAYMVDLIFVPWAPGAKPAETTPWSMKYAKPYERIFE